MRKSLLVFVVVFLFEIEGFGQHCPDFQEVRPDVYVARDTSSWYVNIGSHSTNQLAVANCFYQRHPDRDRYDFIWIDQTSYNNQPPHAMIVAARVGGVLPMRYDASWSLGSRGRLTAIAWDKQEFSDPVGRFYSGSAYNHSWNTLNHEFTHHVCCFFNENRIGISDLFPPTSASISMKNGHFSPFLGTVSDLRVEPEIEDLMQALPWQIENKKATYKSPRFERLQRVSSFTAYTLGLVSPNEIRGKFPILENAVWDGPNQITRADVKRWTDIEELISVQWGSRWPRAEYAQRHFRAAFILLVDMRDEETLKAGIQNWVNQFIESTAKTPEKWYEAMWGRSTLNDSRFKIPRLEVQKKEFKPGETLEIKLSGADSGAEALLLSYDGSNEYRLPLKTSLPDGSWKFTTVLRPEHIGQWSVIVYFSPDHETGGLTHTTSNLLYFEVVSQQK